MTKSNEKPPAAMPSDTRVISFALHANVLISGLREQNDMMKQINQSILEKYVKHEKLMARKDSEIFDLDFWLQ